MKASFVFCLLILLQHAVSAQMNADHKEVKQRKIKTATALDIQYGDTTLTRFTYDEQGRLIHWYYQYGLIEDYTTFDERGNIISLIEILPPDTGTLHSHADTVSKTITRYVTGTDKISYQLHVEYEYGAVQQMEIQNGDTVFYYLCPHGEPVLDGFTITSPIDSLQRTIAECTYVINYHDSSWSLQHCDTVFERCNVTVFDKHGNPVQESYADVQPGAKSVNGKLYTPIGKPGTTLIVFANIGYEYALDGSLKSISRKGPYKDSKEEKHWIFPKDPFNSLKEIELRGKATYTYYN